MGIDFSRTPSGIPSTYLYRPSGASTLAAYVIGASHPPIPTIALLFLTCRRDQAPATRSL